MLRTFDTKKCCGCAACAVSCPQKCISMVKGTLGHFYPCVEQSRCISCGICDRVCPIRKTPVLPKAQRVYATFSLNSGIRFNGSSGGMFELFSRKVLDKGYVVYGAAFDCDFKLKCTVATNQDELRPLLKSKYLQSDISDRYSEIQRRLEQGEGVLIVSTPCQIRALKLYLDKDYEKLITIDFFCHGVPSQDFFDRCKALEEEHLGGEILEYRFREKKPRGATPHYYTVYYQKNGRVKHKTDYYFQSPFYAFFQQYICLRDSCYNCEYAGRERDSDITIGDFHEIDKFLEGINRFDGVSTVVLNTSKGVELFDECKESMYAHELDLNRLIQAGVCFSAGTPIPPERETFLEDYKFMPIHALAHKYVSPKRYMKMRVYYALPKRIRNVIKKAIRE